MELIDGGPRPIDVDARMLDVEAKLAAAVAESEAALMAERKRLAAAALDEREAVHRARLAGCVRAARRALDSGATYSND